MTHGANFDTGLTLIGNGGTHEENPNEGVPMGMDSEGIPNLVEEDEVIMTIVADLPFIAGEQIDDVLDNYYKRGKPAMCVSVPASLFKKYRITPTLVYKGLVPTGVNLLLANNEEQDQSIYESHNVELAFNINTLNDLNLSEHYIKK